MAKYFKNFPQTQYYKEGESLTLDTLTNITARFTLDEDLKNNSVAYYNYQIIDGETPEMLAHRIYESSEKHWIILAVNNIIDPQYDWPLSQRTFTKYIESTYKSRANTGETGIHWSQNNIASYYKIEERTIIQTGNKTTDTTRIDKNTYDTLVESDDVVVLSDGYSVQVVVTKLEKTYYDLELESNERKRVIKILKPELVDSVETEFISVMRDTL